jgi:hypothetical protein
MLSTQFEWRRSFRTNIVLDRHPIFHDENDFLNRVDVLGRIAIDGDNVGELSGLDRADAIGPF